MPRQNTPRNPRPNTRRNTRPAGFTLIEIMVVVLIIGVLLAIAVPNFISARESSRARTCVANLSHISAAKAQCAMDNNLSDYPAVSFSIDGTTATRPGPGGVYQLTRGAANTAGYLRVVPVCPAGGQYGLGAVSATPTCDVSSNPSPDYQPGGRWFHGY